MAWFKLSDARYHQLLRELRRLDDDLAQLRTQHERLRGRFYGSVRHETPDSEAHQVSPPPGSRAEKDAILRDFMGARRHARRPE